MKVSSSHNYISTIGQFYSEEMNLFRGLMPNKIWGRKETFSSIPYEDHIHIDAMKMRLFSPCSKECAGKDETNPALGKAFSVQGMLAWFAGDFQPSVPIFSARWESRFSGFLPSEEYLRYLPRELGGLMVPAFHKSDMELTRIINSVPAIHWRFIKESLIGAGNTAKRRCLRRFSTNVRARGFLTDEIEDQIRGVLGNIDLVQGIDDSALQLLTQKDDLTWSNLRYRDKVWMAKSLKLISIDDAISTLDRPYTFRNLLAPEISMKHGITVSDERAYTSLPWPIRKRRFEEDLDRFGEDLVEATTADKDLIIGKLLSALTTTGRSIDIQKESYFLPESVLLDDTMCTLRTPL
jgi:hypothetical protein